MSRNVPFFLMLSTIEIKSDLVTGSGQGLYKLFKISTGSTPARLAVFSLANPA